MWPRFHATTVTLKGAESSVRSFCIFILNSKNIYARMIFPVEVKTSRIFDNRLFGPLRKLVHVYVHVKNYFFIQHGSLIWYFNDDLIMIYQVFFLKNCKQEPFFNFFLSISFNSTFLSKCLPYIHF